HRWTSYNGPVCSGDFCRLEQLLRGTAQWMRQRFLVVVSAHTPLKPFRLTRLRLRLLLPSIALIVASTMVPTELRHPSLAYIRNIFTADDFVSNLVVYMPLGMDLSGSSLIRAFLVAFSLSTSAEVLQ